MRYIRLMLGFMAALGAFAAPLRFSLRDTGNVLHTQSEIAQKRLTVFIFVACECPITNSYVPAFADLQKQFSSKGVAFYGVLSDPSEDAKHDAQYVNEYRYTFPVLIDNDQSLARYTGANISPEAAVVNEKGDVVYLGRIDDRYPRIGVRKYAATEFDLKNAIESALNGAKPSPDRTKAVGCSIPFELRKK